MNRAANTILGFSWEIGDEFVRRGDSQKLASIQAITDFDLNSFGIDLAVNISHALQRQLHSLEADWRAYPLRTQPGDAI